MSKIAFILSILFATNSPNLPDLNLGDKVPADAIKMNQLVMVSPAQLQPRWLWNYEGVEYTLGVDKERFVQFISTSSLRVSTLEGIRVGQHWGDLVDVPGVHLEEWRGWGKVAVLPSGWMAACYSEVKLSGSEEPKDEQVDELFKGTAAGYGQRPSNWSPVKSDLEAETLKIKNRAELFLTACIQRNWKKASACLSSTSPIILSDDRTAADDWLVGRLEKYQIWTIDGEDYPTAVVFGCAKLRGRGHGTFEFIMTLVSDKEERKIYHFEFLHEGMDPPQPMKCSFRK